MTVLNRNLFAKTAKLLEYFPVVAIIGVRQCGKTTLAKQLRPDWRYLDLENPDDYDLVTSDFTFFFQQNPQKLILDEAQLAPDLFKVLRGVIDKNRKVKNRFILTGSSSSELLGNISESLAGRIAIVELGTLKTNEIFQKPLSPFYQIFQKKLKQADLSFLKSLSPKLDHKQIKQAFFKGGYPEPLISQKKETYKFWMESYFKTYFNRDIRSLFPKLDLVKYRRFLSMLTSLSGTIVNKAELARSIEIDESTAKNYLEIAHGSFVWRNYLSYEKNKMRSVIKMPKGGFRDSGLLHHLAKISTIKELDTHPFVGRNFENFICEEIIKGLQATDATNWDYFFYRTRGGAEIDLLLEGEFGLLPIEIKYGIKTPLKKLAALKSFVKENSLPYGVLINQAEKIELIAPSIIQIPSHFL